MANDRYCINKYYYILSKEVLAWLAYLFSFRSLFLIYASHVHHPPSHQSPPPPISQLLFKVSWTFFSWSRVLGASLVAQKVKHLPAMRETLVWFLGREDPLEKEMAILSSTFAWKIPWTEEPDRLQSMGSQRVGHDWATSLWLVCPTVVNHVYYSVTNLFFYSLHWWILVFPLFVCLAFSNGMCSPDVSPVPLLHCSCYQNNPVSPPKGNSWHLFLLKVEGGW